MVPRPKKPPKAMCAANQAALERLAEKRYQLGDGNNYQFVLKRAMDSVAQCKEAITSYKEALSLKNVGAHCAMIIFPPDTENSSKALKSDGRRKASSSAATLNETSTKSSSNPTKRKINSTAETEPVSDFNGINYNYKNASEILPTNMEPSQSLQKSCHNIERTVPQEKRYKQTNLLVANSTNVVATENDDYSVKCNPTSREANYIKAVRDATQQTYLNAGLHWRVILIVDGRETKSQHIQAKCQMSGIPCEERFLPIGDMAWIAQGYRPYKSSKNVIDYAGRKQNEVVAELMLGTIIERKTTEDLKASLFGTRYFEQRLRLQHSGLPQVLFLIEGDMSKDFFRCSADTLHSAVWETRVHLGFTIIHTEHMDGTVITLKRMHRRILQRTFPNAFFDDALPTFQELYHSNDSRDNHNQRHCENGDRKRRRRRRVQSLMEMLFDTDPVPPLGTNRFITYQELKAKIERDREAGTKTIGSIHMAMLKQVPTLNAGKCKVVSRAYPTVNQLIRAYYSNFRNNMVDANYGMVSSLSTRDPNVTSSTAQQRTIGPRSSSELYVAYGTTNCKIQPCVPKSVNEITLEDNPNVAKNIVATSLGGLQHENHEQSRISEHAKAQPSRVKLKIANESLDPLNSCQFSSSRSLGSNSRRECEDEQQKLNSSPERKCPPKSMGNSLIDLFSSTDDEDDEKHSESSCSIQFDFDETKRIASFHEKTTLSNLSLSAEENAFVLSSNQSDSGSLNNTKDGSRETSARTRFSATEIIEID